MTANDNTPERGQDSTGVDWESSPTVEELKPLDDEELALVVEEQKEVARERANAASEALLNEDVALTDEMVGELWDSGTRLEAVSRALVQRVPEEHQVSEE